VVRQARGEGRAAVIRGEMWLAALDPTIGCEIQKTRLCVILSPAEMNEQLRTVMVAPMTTGSRPAPSRIPVLFQRRAGFILLEQIRTLDKSRLMRRLGAVSAATLASTLDTLREIFAV
jgi:mRNA interferase MazF